MKNKRDKRFEQLMKNAEVYLGAMTVNCSDFGDIAQTCALMAIAYKLDRIENELMKKDHRSR